MMKKGNNWFSHDARKFKKARQLLPPCIDQPGGVWADLGCGEGIFTAVLYEQIGPSSEIYAVDKNQKALNTLKYNFHKTYPEACIQLLHANFTEPLSLPALDGFVLANALHFVKDDQKAHVIGDLSTKLKTNGKIVIIEYNTVRSNFAVPFPFNEELFLKLAKQLNLRKPQIVAKAPSTFLGEMYAGTALAPQDPSHTEIEGGLVAKTTNPHNTHSEGLFAEQTCWRGTEDPRSSSQSSMRLK